MRQQASKKQGAHMSLINNSINLPRFFSQLKRKIHSKNSFGGIGCPLSARLLPIGQGQPLVLQDIADFACRLRAGDRCRRFYGLLARLAHACEPILRTMRASKRGEVLDCQDSGYPSGSPRWNEGAALRVKIRCPPPHRFLPCSTALARIHGGPNRSQRRAPILLI